MASSNHDTHMPSSNSFGRLCAGKLRSRSFVSIEIEEASNERVHSSISIGCRDVGGQRIHPTSTLKNITDDDADTKHGEIADDINEENGRAQGLAYEKELGEAKDDTMVEILVTRLKNDTTLTKCRTVACPKIECWAARYGFVNIVMALIQSRGQSEFLEKEAILLTAVENNHVGLVKHLIAMREVDVNHGVAEIGYWKDCTSGGRIRKFTDRHDHLCWVTPIDAAARMGNVEMVNILLACDRIDVNKGQPLLWAARWNHPQVVEALLNNVKSQVDVNAVQYWQVDESIRGSYYGRSFTALHLASFYGHTATAARAPRTGKHIGVLVQSLHMSLLVASVLLTVSVACVMGAFASAGFAVLPPVQTYTTIMQVTVAIDFPVYVRTEFLDMGGDEANTGMILES
ncbi:unnamed protein product [Sphagnum jensenii]|uniref:Uncharacterized protein n=1 Tax=Sphagnum jensenii TaxID=128206 RepID=A0ABP1BAI5_9BRYO